MARFDVHSAGPTPDQEATEAVIHLYERRIESLRAWAWRRLTSGQPIAPSELVDQINVWFPEGDA